MSKEDPRFSKYSAPIKATLKFKCPETKKSVAVDATELMVEPFPDVGYGSETWVGFSCPSCGKEHLIKN